MRAARTASILSVTALLALGAAGCGGSKLDYEEVPGGPVDVSIPTDPNLDTSGSGSSDSGSASAPGGEDTANSDSPPPAGSDAQQFEDFCAQNPGAC